MQRGGGVAAGLERGQVHGGLHQRADRPARIERAIEAVGVDLAAAHHRDHVAAVRLGDDHGAFQMLVAHAARRIEALQILGERALRGGLRARIEARVHGQARGGEIRLGVVALQMPAHEIEIGGHVAAARGAQAERARGRALRGRGIDEMRIRELLQHEIAPRESAVGMLARIVVGRPLDQPDQQRELAGVELVERLGEVVLAAKAEAVDRRARRPGRDTPRSGTRPECPPWSKCASRRSAMTASVALRPKVCSSDRK